MLVLGTVWLGRLELLGGLVARVGIRAVALRLDFDQLARVLLTGHRVAHAVSRQVPDRFIMELGRRLLLDQVGEPVHQFFVLPTGC